MIWIERNNNDKVVYLTSDGKVFETLKSATVYLNCSLESLLDSHQSFDLVMNRFKKIKKIISKI